jgi:molecular chaperone GrpE (heat shock protein)
VNRTVSFAQWAQQARTALHDRFGLRPARQNPELTSVVESGGEVEVPADLVGLEKQIARLGREQFKLSSLIEVQQQQTQAALQQLRDQDARREQERVVWLTQRQSDQAEARLQFIQQLLPVLDGLDKALATGERLLQRAPTPAQPQASKPAAGRVTLWANILAWPVALAVLLFPRLVREPARAVRTPAELTEWQDAYLAWLRGLQLVRERLLETLAAEGVRPIETVGQPFDPQYHMAVDTVPAGPGVAAGIVVAEQRSGYAIGARVLRYAEVVVARATEVQLISPEKDRQVSL